MADNMSAQQRARVAQLLLGAGEARSVPPSLGQRAAGMASSAINNFLPPGNPYARGVRDLALGSVPESLDMLSQGEPGVMLAKSLGALPLGAIIFGRPVSPENGDGFSPSRARRSDA